MTMHEAVKKYARGEKCWIYVTEYDEDDGSAHQKLVEGTVLFSFTRAGQVGDFYVIEVGDPSWQCYEVRDALCMSDRADKPMLWNGPSRVKKLPRVYGGSVL